MPEVQGRLSWECIPVSKVVDEILNSILEEFEACRQATEELEAKALFRLLNYRPPPSANVPLQDREEKADEVDHAVVDVLRVCLVRDFCLCLA